MDKNEVINKVRQYAELLNNHFDMEKVILYGSYARNNQKKYSDIDVAVVVKKLDSDYFTFTSLLWKLWRDRYAYLACSFRWHRR
jgi:uncharacterized protein